MNKIDTENIMMIEFIQPYGDKIKIPMVALFNKNRVSEKEVHEAIALYGCGVPRNIVIITKEQHESVFLVDEA